MSLQNPYFPLLEIDGERFEFTHLEPFQMVVPSERAKKNLQVHVRYSNHCFSRRLYEGEAPREEQVFPDHNNRPRVLCRDRFALSFRLPEYLAGLNDPRTKVNQTVMRRNWAYVVRLEDAQGPYYVFFELERARNNSPDDLQLFVESAYRLTEGFKQPQLRGRMGFQLLCGKVYLRERVFTR